MGRKCGTQSLGDCGLLWCGVAWPDDAHGNHAPPTGRRKMSKGTKRVDCAERTG